jgi:hypothetical protein
VLQAGQIVVSARLQRAIEGLVNHDWDVYWRVVHGTECLELQSHASGADASAVMKALRGDVVQRGKYVFIACEDQGGNHWKGRGSEVIGLESGHLVPLGWLGELDFESYAADTCYKDGEFFDLDADWESEFTGHAGAPKVELVLRDSAGTLVADRDRTWKRCLPTYLSNESEWRNWNGGSSDDFGRTQALFENAVIAAYCARPREFSETIDEVDRVVKPELVRAIRETLAKVRPGVLPRRSRPWSAPCKGSR